MSAFRPQLHYYHYSLADISASLSVFFLFFCIFCSSVFSHFYPPFSLLLLHFFFTHSNCRYGFNVQMRIYFINARHHDVMFIWQQLCVHTFLNWLLSFRFIRAPLEIDECERVALPCWIAQTIKFAQWLWLSLSGCAIRFDIHFH